MRHNRFSRGYFLPLILLVCVAAGERPTSAQGRLGKGAGECDGPRARSILVAPRPPVRVLGGLGPAIPSGSIYRPLSQLPAATPDRHARRDTSATLRIDTSGGDLYNLADNNGRIFYSGDSDRDVARTLNGMIGQDQSAVRLTVKGQRKERDATITSLSIKQWQIDPGVSVKRESYLGSVLDTNSEIVTLAQPSLGEKLQSYVMAMPSRLFEYRARRRTNKLIKRSIKRLARTHPAASKEKLRKEAGRTRVVSIPRTQRAAELWTTA